MDVVKNLKESSETIDDEIIAYEQGKIVQIMDIEGNKIELRDTADSVFIQMDW